MSTISPKRTVTGNTVGEPQRGQILIGDLREALKAIIRNEIEELPKHLAQMDAKARLEIICKIMPFVFPKMEAIAPTSGEPFEMNWNSR